MRAWVLAVGLVLGRAVGASTAEGLERWRSGDHAGAVAAFQRPAGEGDAEALFHLGQAHRLGLGAARDVDLALDYYRRAAARGHVAAMANLGITLFQLGRRAEAMEPLRHAAHRGDARAAYVLGLAVFSGEGAARDPVLGLAYVLRARALGLGLAEAQAERLARLLSPEARLRADATARALAAGAPPAPAAVRAPASSAEVAPVDAAPAGPHDKPWGVQLGAYTSEAAARAAWAALVARSADLPPGQVPRFLPAGSLVRLVVGAFPDRDSARALCRRLAAAGRPCFVTRG
ncbi:MAG: SPOR domain-containing protein [Sphingomonadaceae bacterium]|uniref:SPOR domain-containing protein n=1 Tax=Thermaurantiacus sp. TaxID=2820283 RepID=UPI00298F3E09|nr:SPOR domain-containing protein [Thermaurantiacus sp.]MCS6987610.1 SPOR domain-containing protein [Sphingomonadaceae bacterium]MDW8415211.1 SPOR domain-containing protein [Thermaurantiacus sp.]